METFDRTEVIEQAKAWATKGINAEYAFEELADFAIEHAAPIEAERDALREEVKRLRDTLQEVKDVLDYGRRHSHGMYAFTKLREGYEKAEAILAKALEVNDEPTD